MLCFAHERSRGGWILRPVKHKVIIEVDDVGCSYCSVCLLFTSPVATWPAVNPLIPFDLLCLTCFYRAYFHLTCFRPTSFRPIIMYPTNMFPSKLCPTVWSSKLVLIFVVFRLIHVVVHCCVATSLLFPFHRCRTTSLLLFLHHCPATLLLLPRHCCPTTSLLLFFFITVPSLVLWMCADVLLV